MYIITKHDINNNDILILYVESDHTDEAYNNCLNKILDDTESKEDDTEKKNIQIIDRLNIHVHKYGIMGKYLYYRYEIHLFE